MTDTRSSSDRDALRRARQIISDNATPIATINGGYHRLDLRMDEYQALVCALRAPALPSGQVRCRPDPFPFRGTDPALFNAALIIDPSIQLSTTPESMREEALRKAKEIAGACGVAQAEQQRGKPVAWAVFEDNGNIRMWSTVNLDVEEFAARIGKVVTPLYASPPAALPAGLSEEERHAVEHARYQVERATPNNPECGFDYDLVKDLICAIDRAYPLPSTEGSGRG